MKNVCNLKSKIFIIEDKLKHNILKKDNLMLFFIVVVILLAIIMRISMFNFQSKDYVGFIEKWFYQIKELGGFKALKYNIGDYNVPYVTILAMLTYIPISPLISVKIVSVIFDFIGAIYASKLVYELLKNKYNAKLYASICFAVILFLPTVFINSALWGQCDFIYVSFILMSLYYLLKNKVLKSFVLLGIAFSFKLQFIFILPIYILLYFRRSDISILHFLIIPIVNLIMCLPSLLAGRSIVDCMKIYFLQTVNYTQITINYPNLYNIFVEFFNTQSIVLIIFTIAILGTLIFYILYKRIDIEKNILKIALMTSLLMVYFLPRMHERYAFVCEIIAIIYVIVEKKDFYLPIILQISTLTGYYAFFASDIFNFEYLNLFSIIEFIAIIRFTINTIKTLESKDIKILPKGNI